MQPIAKAEPMHLFCWNDVPGRGCVQLLKYLKNELKIEWVGDVEIKKSGDDKVISITKENNTLALKLDKEKKKVILEISDREPREYIFREESGKLEVYANPVYFQTLRGHIVDSLKILKSYIETNNDVIGQFCNRWNLNMEAFLKSLFLTVYLHDIGKLTKQFQENIKNGKSSQRYPHAFYGLFILNTIDFPSLLDAPLEKCAIMGHHTELHKQLYLGYEGFEKPSFLENEINTFILDARETYDELGFNKWFLLDQFGVGSLPKFRHLELQDTRQKIIRDATLFDDKEKLKSIFCYILSILKTCDDYSSAEFSDFTKGYSGSDNIFDSVMSDPTAYTPRLTIDSPYDKILGRCNPYNYQKDDPGELCGDVPFYSLLFAPCGRGKTEAALIWASKALGKYHRNKIIFAMPTQITSNAMWERFCGMFGEGETEKEKIKAGREFVGLFHGKSFIKLKGEKKDEEKTEDLETEDIEEIKGENFKGNVFFKPITVTTIDHLIYSFIHGFSQADFALGNLQNAVVVFDEVHYYEKKTLEHLMTLLGLLKRMKIPHLLMSGTLPEFFIENAKKVNAEYKGPFRDEDGLQFEPFKIETHFGEKMVTKDYVNEKVMEEIKENYHKGLIQFVILNTIERSKRVYNAIIDKLTQSDRCLFTLPPDCKEYLVNGLVSLDLKDAFQKHGQLLSDTAQITTLGEMCVIGDGNKKFLIRTDVGQLAVYDFPAVVLLHSQFAYNDRLLQLSREILIKPYPLPLLLLRYQELSLGLYPLLPEPVEVVGQLHSRSAEKG